jgi:endonuclease-3
VIYINKQLATTIMDILIKAYPEAGCSLDFETPFQMLVAVCLSAQCTDERVNKTTPDLFKKYSTPKDFASADISEVEKLIHSCGFYKNKAKNLVNAGKKIVDDFNGIVPNNMEDLMTIPGVGRKSANVIMLEAFNDPQGIAVDTHCKRVSNRLDLSKKSEPTDIEEDLLKLLPKEYYKDVNHVLIYFGRETCKSQNPKCDKCPVKDYCKYKK